MGVLEMAPPMTVADLAKALWLHDNVVRNIIGELESTGKVVAVGKRRGSRRGGPPHTEFSVVRRRWLRKPPLNDSE